MHRITLVLALGLPACTIGDDPAATGALAATSDDVGADSLRWDSFASNCASAKNGIVAIGGDLSVLFGAGARWTQCSVSGVIRVPADLRLTSLYQAVRTDGVATPLQYTARLGGSTVTSRTTSARDGFETTANISAFGSSLCARTGTSTRTVTFSITTAVQTEGAFLDSIDWSIGAEPCP